MVANIDTIIDSSIDYGPFKYGVNDCCAHASNILVKCGAPNFYSDLGVFNKKTSILAMKRLGCKNVKDLIELLAKNNNWQSISNDEAKSADVAIFKHGRDYVVGIVKSGFILAKTKDGIAGVPVQHARSIWRVL